MLKDTQAYIKACDKCQRFSNLIRQPSEALTPMTALWPFAQWVEAEPLATIMKKSIRSFVWRNIICRYRIPRVLVSDNRKQFDNGAFRDFCTELGIKNHY